MRILIVEDEARLADSVARGLREEGFVVEVSHDGEDALHRLRTESFDLAILDVMLPKRDGWAVLDTLRAERRAIRVLMLTARQTVEDRVRGLEAGADDYLVKPFAFAELLARVRAVLRRPVAEESLHLRHADLELDYRARTVTRAGQPMALSAKEFAVLAFLLRHPGEVITRRELMSDVWGYKDDVVSRTLDTHVFELRRKLGHSPPSPGYIETIMRVGYRVVA